MRSTHLVVYALATAVASCGPSQAPQLTGLSDQVAQVGTELTIELDGTSTAGGRLSYNYKAPDLKDLQGNANITVAPSGAGIFRWTPLAQDIGTHPFDFIVSNGGASSTTTIQITVKSAIGQGTAPVFRQPLGTGTTVDLSKTMCVDVDVVVDDQAAANIKITQEQPVIDGGKLTTLTGQTAKWHWCPTAAQQATSRYTLLLSADDGVNPKTEKPYLIVLQNTAASCPGAGPALSSTPADQTTRLDLPVTVAVTDMLGVKDAPLLYYSTTNPGANPNVSAMTQVSTTLASGDAFNGSYTGTIPNPVATAADGSMATLYYVFGASDHDTTNNCDHVTTSQVYTMNVTAGGSSTAGLCSACTADSQCGAGNECVYMGSMGASYCLQGCGASCPTGYSCSNTAITSVNNAMAVQCVPQSGSCAAPTGTCSNDLWDPNQTQSEASANGALISGSWSFVDCPSTTTPGRGEDDWFQIQVPAAGHLDITLAGDGAIDLDLNLYHSDGTLVDASLGPTDQEALHDCASALTYYIKVNGYGNARDAYTLTWSSTAGACP